MSVQCLPQPLQAYRIGDPDGDFPIFDATGAQLYPGRWNDQDTPVIYACEHYSTAMLEKLAHAGSLLPPNQHYITITLPQGLSYEVVTKDHLPGWDTEEPTASAAFGAAWATEQRSALLIVPSYVARLESVYVINPAHPDFPQIQHDLPTPVWWDRRLFGAP